MSLSSLRRKLFDQAAVEMEKDNCKLEPPTNIKWVDSLKMYVLQKGVFKLPQIIYHLVLLFFLLIYFHRSILKSPKSPPILVGDEVLIHDNNRNKQGKMNKNIHQNWKNQINLEKPDNTFKCEISLESQLNNFWTTLSFTLNVM